MKKGWVTKKLGDLGRAVREQAKIALDKEYELWSVPSFEVGMPEHSIGKDIGSAKLKVQPNDVLICKINPRINRVWLVSKPIGQREQIGSTEWLVFRANHDSGLSPEWLIHFVSGPKFREWIVSEVSGATGSHTRAKTDGILRQEVPVPPLPEQQRIVRILDEAFAAIATAKANTEKNLQNARAIFESHLNDVFTKRGDGWVETTLGDEIDLLAGFAFKSSQYTEKGKDVRLLRGDNIIQGCLRWDDVKRWPANDTKEYERYGLRAGDVVLAMDRPWVKAGLKHATINAEDLPCLLVQRTARLRGGTNLDNRFLMFLIGSSAFTSHILGIQTGIGVPHISGQQIKDFTYARPSLAIQRRIAEDLDALLTETQRLTSLYTRKLSALEDLKKSLLHQAFNGEL